MNKHPWFKNSWRRILVDMHITDRNEEFLSKLDAEAFVQMILNGGASTLMACANSHVGYCYYPTKVGKMHPCLKGRDFLGELINAAQSHNVNPIIYYTLIFHNVAYLEHPDWHATAMGWQVGKLHNNRYGVCCPNSPYREFALQEIREICDGYNAAGMWFDMTFWPGTCYCAYCLDRYKKEVGKVPPKIIDWNNPEWIKFQRTREKWMTDFGKDVTETVRGLRPDMTVTHQFSTIVHPWRSGPTLDLVDYCDYLTGDFYDLPSQQSVICKAFHNLSLNKPFELMTSRCMDLTDHVTTKSYNHLQTQAFTATAHNSAFWFIDAINPAGTLNPNICTLMRSIHDKTAVYEKNLDGQLCADVAVYYSWDSKFDHADNGKNIEDTNHSSKIPHLNALMGACQKLQREHIPYTVLTRRDLSEFAKYQLLVLPNVMLMSEEEAAAIREYVRNGGSIYASCRTGYAKDDGTTIGDFQLADVFGVSTKGKISEGLKFYSPASASIRKLMVPQDHMIHHSDHLEIENRGASILATATLPYADPEKTSIKTNTFAAIHSNPPGPVGDQPAVTLNHFGKGLACYCSGAIEDVDWPVNQKVFVGLISELMNRPVQFQAQTHESIEVILFHQPEKKYLLVNLLNLEPKLVETHVDAKLQIRLLDNSVLKQVLKMPDGKIIAGKVKNTYVEIEISDIVPFTQLRIEYK